MVMDLALAAANLAFMALFISIGRASYGLPNAFSAGACLAFALVEFMR